MHADIAVNVELLFSEVAKHAFDPDTDLSRLALPAGFLAQAHFAVPGDLLHLQGSLAVFVVTQRTWTIQAGRSTLQLLLDVLVRDDD